MNTEQIIGEIGACETKEIELSNGKRLCYLIPCDNCGIYHYKAQCEILKGLRRNKRFFCSIRCKTAYHSTIQNVICANCGFTFMKVPSQIVKTSNNFCSKSCAATFNNKHKTHGTRRSKLEIMIEQMLQTEYPSLIFHCNEKNSIGSELDFYFPNLKLAIQINGPLHYQPIYGQKKLNQIQVMDNEKRKACEIKDILLVEIDCSDDKYLNKKKIAERLLQVKKILAEARELASHTQ